MHFITTNIRLDEVTMKELKLRAVHESRPMTEVVRDALRSYLRGMPIHDSDKGSEEDSILNMIGLYESKEPKGYERLDEVVYGKKRKSR